MVSSQASKVERLLGHHRQDIFEGVVEESSYVLSPTLQSHLSLATIVRQYTLFFLNDRLHFSHD